MLKKMLILILIFSITLVVFSVGCSENNESDKIQQDSVQGNSSKSGSEKILKIYYFQDYYSLNANALSEFKKNHNDIKIEEKALRVNELDSFKMKFATELLAGEGPDIMSLPIFGFPAVTQLMERGLLCDLNPLISKDGDFKIEDYNEDILNVGVYEGKRYIIPLDYNFSYFYTYKSLLDKNHIKLDTSNWTWDSIVNVMKEYYKDGSGTSEYFFSSSLSIWDIIVSSETNFVDYKKKISNFNSPQFIRLLQTYKEIVPYICPEKVSIGTQPDQLLKQSILQSAISGKISSIVDSNNFVRKAVGEEAILLPHPAFSGKKRTTAFAYNLVAITSKCKYKDEASDFVKNILSEENQSNLSNGAPVMKSVFNKQFEDVKSTEKIGSQIFDLIQNIKKCTLGDANVENIIAKELPDFVNGRKTAEQTAKVIDDKVMILLNE